MVQVIILARESGLKLELSDIPIQSLVPDQLKVRKNLINVDLSRRLLVCICISDLFSGALCQDVTSADEFMKQLHHYDQDLAKQRQEAEATGEVSTSKF